MKSNWIASQINRYRVVSLVLHGIALVGLGMLLRHLAATRVAVSQTKTQTAQHIILSLPGSVEAGSPKAKSKDIAKPVSKQATLSAPPVPPHQGRPSPTPQTGEGLAGQSAWGKGQITIAYTRFFPYPAPDLSTMRAGTEGDVVLTALIDEQGKIKDLTLLSGIDPPINQNVMQTVSQWTFTPATKDGQPIESRQEIHFHFRSSRDG
jgi:protein TonB